MPNKSQTYIDFSWTVWHQGNPIFDDKFPGTYLNLGMILQGALNEQTHNHDATDRILNASNAELLSYLPMITDEVLGFRELPRHFRWVAQHEGKRADFLIAVGDQRYSDIRNIYYQAQKHNPDTKYLLAGVSNLDIKNLVENL